MSARVPVNVTEPPPLPETPVKPETLESVKVPWDTLIVHVAVAVPRSESVKLMTLELADENTSAVSSFTD